jgi:hypothetical protein
MLLLQRPKRQLHHWIYPQQLEQHGKLGGTVSSDPASAVYCHESNWPTSTHAQLIESIFRA